VLQPSCRYRVIGSVSGVEEIQIAVIQPVVDVALEGDIDAETGIGPIPEVLIIHMAGPVGVEFILLDDSAGGTQQRHGAILMVL
jgi:hypothetical protein